uniref:Toxin candidate TRINITY_DN7890_c0_g1_i1 n=1 Tax=Isarachnanthus nocturnus TaxID=1240238 RepID=A0A7G7WZ24_9CNID|nr:toxin candidate TRINITY_DN7890_c0_g1_i1 [Isarachnanthus nocturnus]
MTLVWRRDHLTLVLSLSLLGVSCSWALPRTLCEVDRQTNGCSVPFGIDAPFKREFIPACDKHDICYGCGHHYNWTREECDRGFFEDMKGLCKERSEFAGRKKAEILPGSSAQTLALLQSNIH